MARDAAQAVRGLRYMAAFRCTGAECPDQCCTGGWTIPVDQGRLAKIRKALSRDSVALEAVVTMRPPAQRTKGHFATLRMDAEGGACALLDQARLCSLHARHGEEMLPEACAMYPRLVARVGDRVELAGSLSCPEVARLALFGEGATDVVDLPAERAGRGAITQEVAAEDADTLDQLRRAMAGLLDLRQYPLRGRLFLAAYLAHRAPGGDLAAVGHETARLLVEGADVLAELHRRFVDSVAQAPPPVGLLLNLIGTRIDWAPGRAVAPAFHRVVGEVMLSYAAEAGAGVTVSEHGEGAGAQLGLHAEGAALSRAYLRRRDVAGAALSDVLDAAFTHYARHFFYREWPQHDPGMVVHVHGLLLRVALLRFLFFSHPRALEAARSGDLAAARGVLVEVCYSFARIIEHNDVFSRGLREAIQRHLADLSHAVLLLAV